jgi:hypothetical protein
VTKESPGNGQTLLPSWLEKYIITTLVGLVLFMADKRIVNIEVRLDTQEKARQVFDLQYVQDRASILEGQRQTLHDIRVLCGHKNLNKPCPVED